MSVAVRGDTFGKDERQLRARQVRIGEIGVAHIAIAEIGIRDVGARELGAPQIGAMEIGMARFDLVEPGWKQARVGNQEWSDARVARRSA